MNYKCLPKFVFYFIMALFGFLEFPSVKSSKLFTAHHTVWERNVKHEKSRVQGSALMVVNRALTSESHTLSRKSLAIHAILARRNSLNLTSHFRLIENYLQMSLGKLYHISFLGFSKFSIKRSLPNQCLLPCTYMYSAMLNPPYWLGIS